MRKLLLLTVVMIPLNAFGEECIDMIEFAKVRQEIVSDKNDVEVHARNFCNAYSRYSRSEEKEKYGVEFNFLAASFGRSTVSVNDVALKYCEATDSSQSKREAYKQYVESIAPDAYKSYEQCLIMSHRDLKFNVNHQSKLAKEFDMTVSYTSPLQNALPAVVTFSHSEDVNCLWENGSSNKLTIKRGSTVGLKCKRKDGTNESYVTLVRSDIGTPQELTLRWKQYGKDGRPVDSLLEFESRIKDLETRIAISQKGFDEKLRSLGGACKIREAETLSSNSTWGEGSKAQCQGRETAMGGGCRVSQSSAGANGGILKTGDRPTGYECIVNQNTHGERVRAEAICCGWDR